MTPYELSVLQLVLETTVFLTVLRIAYVAYERYEFRKYERRRRRYTKWRLSHLDEIQ